MHNSRVFISFSLLHPVLLLPEVWEQLSASLFSCETAVSPQLLPVTKARVFLQGLFD